MSMKQSANEAGRDNDQDLTSILDDTQRADLTFLIANITDSMRKIIEDNFSATAGLDQTKFLKDGMTDDEKMMSTDTKADISEYEKQKKLKAEFEKELNTKKTQDLKRNALKAYDQWREQVVSRVGEVVNDKETAHKQLKRSESATARPQAPSTAGKIVEAPQKNKNLKFKDLFPPTKTSLTKLSMDKRTLILHAILLLLISLEHYNAASRVLLLNLTSSLKLPLRTFEQDEYVTAKGLLENAKELSGSEEAKKRVEENQDTRQRKVRYATIAGAAIIGVAGSFAAPLLAAGIGSVATGLGLGTTAAAGYLGSVASSSLLVGSLFGAYGGRMTGQMMDKYAREVEDFEFLPVHSNTRTSENPAEGAQQASEHDHKLRVTICLSGWLREKEEVVKPWRVVGSGAEVFALKYELEALLNLGNAMDGMVQSAAWGYAQRELIQKTVFADLMAAMWPMGLMKVARVLDNPFSVAKARAEKVGEILADALVNKAQGERPVTLIGYSLGARAIYVCLQSLARRGAFNLVENAILIGAPTPSDTSDWRVLRTAVVGRLVNVYSANDYILGFMYRTSAIQYGVAGLQPVKGLPGVENVDVSEDVDGHLRYRFLIGGILKEIGFEDVDMQAVEEEEEALKKMLEEEKKNSLRAQRKRLLRQESYKKDGKVDEDALAEDEANELEQQVKQNTQRSLVTRAIEWWYTPRAPNSKDAEKVAKNLQRAMQNPADVGATATDTVRDTSQYTTDMARRVYQALPNIPYMSSSGQTGGKAQVSSAKGDASSSTEKQSYTARAANYLPQSMPSMPSMPSLPEMPSLSGYTKKKENKSSKPAQMTKDAGKAAQNLTDTATETVGTTVKNTANVNDNPATKQLRNAPGIRQAVDNDPGVTQTLGKVTGALGTTVGNTTDKTTNITNNVVDNVGKGGGKAVDAADSGARKAANSATNAVKSSNKEAEKSQEKSYTSYAASYLPSLPTWNSKKDSAQDKTTNPSKSPPPKLERRGSSQVKSKPPKLERRGSSTAGPSKSPPPKLGPRRASDGKSSRPSSPRANSGSAGQTLPNIAERLPSQAQGVMGAPQKATEAGADATGRVVSQGQEVAKGGASAVSGALGSGKKVLGFGR